ncbi:MAG: sugar nucleotide-binding protein [Bacteroidetes bacterium]|jgi:dTDP-4-dehydrorhamnose reductase|nr:sugar nucleotide-binding protein [Bacteroidota bacterium]
MERRVLITGANGLLGQKLVAKLQGRTGLSLLATGEDESHKLQGDYAYAQMDLNNAVQMSQVVRDFGPTELINCAAITNVDACEKEQQLCHRVNAQAVEELAQLCLELDARLIHISTDFIFDGEESPYDERATANPLSTYGHSKWLAEERIQEVGVRAAILRTALVYGVLPDLSRSNIILWVKKSLEAGQQIRVINDQVRSPTLAEDLADGVIAVLMREKTGIYHLAGPDILNVWEIAQQTAQFFGLDTTLMVPTDSTTLNQPARRPPQTGMIILKAQTELDYRPHTLAQGLAVIQRQLQAMA